MELSRKDIERYREKLLETYKAFCNLCEQNGLRWYMAFGSAIGTVRHKGFIPWDDDIDVLMPRADYERFLKLQVHGATIIGPRLSEGWTFPFAKFCDAGSTIWERQVYPSVMGVFVDVFPLDEADPDPRKTEALRKAYHLNYRNYRRSLRTYQSGEMRRRLAGRDFSGALKVFLDQTWYASRAERYYRRFLEMEEHLAAAALTGSGKNVMYSTVSDYKGVTLPAEWFAATVEMPFEDTTARMPSGYDEMLRTFYGNYMELPAREQQVSNHFHYFVDLERALSIDQVMEILP